MREEGLDQAIRAAGGVGALARLLGIAQPSVSVWQRVPAERVLAVESVTGIPRGVLRPDLYPAEEVSAGPADEIDLLRAREYELLAALLGRAPDAAFLAALAGLRGDASPLGLAHMALAEAASATAPEAASREYFDLFIGVGRGELLPYGSYYLTGFLHERPLARLRADLEATGITRGEGMRHEPEDHIAILCEIMAGLAEGRFGDGDAGQAMFERHLAPWASRFFADLETAATARFYRAVGTLGRTFMDIESRAFALPG